MEKQQWEVLSLVNKERVEALHIPKKFMLFTSCTGSVEYPGTERAIKFVLDKLGYEVYETRDQTCCTGYLLTTDALDPTLAVLATGRNLSLAEAQGLAMGVFCNGCFGYNRELNNIIQEAPGMKETVNNVLKEFGREYKGNVQIFHVQEIWYKEIERLRSMVVRPLTGLRVAAHYGCHYVAQKRVALDDYGYPTFHEEIYSALGATPVSYNEKRACCGYSVAKAFTHREEVVLPHLKKKFQSAVDEGVQLMTTVCPGCNVGLDREQPALREMGVPTSIPVMDLSQLIAFALGAPVDILGFEMNTTPVMPVLEKYL